MAQEPAENPYLWSSLQVRALEEKPEVSINIPEEPRIAGALGAAYLALDLV
jgi:activator of 2-hydroxyglutaryl-CoA dehydratase